MVSAGLGLAGGGAAALGRVVSVAVSEYCLARDLHFEVLHLGKRESALEGLPVRHFNGRRHALAAAVAAVQLGRRNALVFDHLGPARVQALLPAPFRSPYAVFLLGVELERPLAWDRQQALAAATLRLAISEHTRGLALRTSPALGPVAVLHPALEERGQRGDNTDEALLARVGRGFLLIVGRLSAQERYKGHDALLDGFPALRAACPGARLLVVGEGDDRGRLEARARAAGLEDAVTFTGFVNQATRAALYERSLAFVLPSRGEGFGLVYLEAMRAGKPCVALTHTAAAEIVVDEQTGLLVEDTGEPLIAALCRLLGDPGLASRLGAAAQRRFVEAFSLARFEGRLAEHLDRLLEAA